MRCGSTSAQRPGSARLRDARRGPPARRTGHRRGDRPSWRRTAGRRPRRCVDGLELVPRRQVRPRRPCWSASSTSPPCWLGAPRWPWSTSWPTPTSPGAHRHAKRWQDVETLLAAGIDVITTVNIQHLESLNDVVESITGIRQRETVPDAVVRAADTIELVDMSPQALRRRMAHGNVYAAGQDRRRAVQLLPGGQPGRAARAGAALAGRPGRRRPGATARTRDRPAPGHPGAGRGRGLRRAGVVGR